jgi:hypothetical protein
MFLAVTLNGHISGLKQVMVFTDLYDIGFLN